MENIKLKITPLQREKLISIYSKLLSIQCTESAITGIEVLFFEVLAICTNSKEVVEFADLLTKLRLIQEQEYQQVQNQNLTQKNRILAIKRFKNGFRLAIHSSLKKSPKRGLSRRLKG